MGGSARFQRGTMGKVGPKLSFLKGNQGQLFQFCTERLECLILHIIDPNYLSFYLKCPRKYKKPYILTFFDTSQICTSRPPTF